VRSSATQPRTTDRARAQDFKFKDYSPQAFRRIRARFGPALPPPDTRAVLTGALCTAQA
jgi:hypothetical protein